MSAEPGSPADGPRLAGPQHGPMSRVGVNPAEAVRGVPGSVPLGRQPGGDAPTGWLAAANDGSRPAMPVALVVTRGPQAAGPGAPVSPDDGGRGGYLVLAPSAAADAALPARPEPAGQPTTRAALPGASPARRVGLGAAAVDDFFQATGRWAGGRSRRDADAAQADSPLTRDVAAGAAVLFALLGTPWAARDEERQADKPGRRPG